MKDRISSKRYLLLILLLTLSVAWGLGQAREDSSVSNGYSVNGAGNIHSRRNNSGSITAKSNTKSQEPRSSMQGGRCTLAGSWEQTAEEVGTSIWEIDNTGKASESGLGGATGTATLTGNKLRIDWKTSNGFWSGYYEWQLDSDCNSGQGELVFQSGGSGTRKSTVTRQRVGAPGPAPEAPPPSQAVAQVQGTADGSGLELGKNRPGEDYKNFDLPDARPELCRDACRSDANCRAFTYVKPDVQGPKARCWLKSTVPDAVKNDCCVSGVISERREAVAQSQEPTQKPTPNRQGTAVAAPIAKGDRSKNAAVARLPKPTPTPAALEMPETTNVDILYAPEHSPQKLDFGEVWEGQSATRGFNLTVPPDVANKNLPVTVEIPNPNPEGAFRVTTYRRFSPKLNGQETVSYDDIRGNENYSPWIVTVDPGDELQIGVTFQPNPALSVDGPGEETATMKLRGPGPRQPWTLTVPLRATFKVKTITTLFITTRTGSDDLRKGSGLFAFLILRDGRRIDAILLLCGKGGQSPEVRRFLPPDADKEAKYGSSCSGIPGGKEARFDWDISDKVISPQEVARFGLQFDGSPDPFVSDIFATGDNWNLDDLEVSYDLSPKGQFIMFKGSGTPLYRFITKNPWDEWMTPPLKLPGPYQK